MDLIIRVVLFGGPEFDTAFHPDPQSKYVYYLNIVKIWHLFHPFVLVKPTMPLQYFLPLYSTLKLHSINDSIAEKYAVLVSISSNSSKKCKFGI